MKPTLLAPALPLSLIGLCLVACPSGSALENQERFLGPGAACDAKPLFEQRCGSSLCHQEEDGDPPSGGIDLVSPGVEARIFGKEALAYSEVDDPENCPEQKELLLDPSDVERSLVLTKLTGAHACGDSMPIPNPPSALESNEIDCVRSWLSNILVNPPANAGTGGAPGTGGEGNTNMGGASSTGGNAGTGGGTSALPLRLEAEDGTLSGDLADTPDGNAIEFWNVGNSVSFEAADLTGFTQATLQYSKGNTGGTIEIRLDAADGTLVGTFTPTGTGGWTMFAPGQVTFDALSGSHSVFLVSTGEGVANLDYIEFSEGASE